MLSLRSPRGISHHPGETVRTSRARRDAKIVPLRHPAAMLSLRSPGGSGHHLGETVRTSRAGHDVMLVAPRHPAATLFLRSPGETVRGDDVGRRPFSAKSEPRP